VLLVEDIVGNSKVSVEDMFVIVKEDLFPRSLTGATMQDGSTRERRGCIEKLLSSRKF